MTKITKDQLVEAISSLSVIELSELVKTLEERFGVSVAAPTTIATSSGVSVVADTTVAEEKSEFTIVLVSAGASKINVIKIVREVTGLGLKEAKDLVDGAPKTVKENVVKVEAEEIKKRLVDVGATVELK